MRSQLRQYELAELLGYEQSYVSSIELGTKPASEEFMRKLVEALHLSEEDVDAMRQAALQSVRRRVLPLDAPTETYLLWHELSCKIGNLHPAQIKLIRDALRIGDEMIKDFARVPPRLRRQRKEETKM